MEVVQQHLQAQQLDGGEAVAAGLAAAAAEVEARRGGRAVEARRMAWGKDIEIQRSVQRPLTASVTTGRAG